LTTTRSVLDLLALCLVYSFLVILIDIVVLFVIYQELSQVFSYLSLLIIAEGGLGLTVGGFIGLNLPIIRRLEEDFFHVKPQNPQNKKEFEKNSRAFIVTGIILVITALLISVI
jgi:hypothetical protein